MVLFSAFGLARIAAVSRRGARGCWPDSAGRPLVADGLAQPLMMKPTRRRNVHLRMPNPFPRLQEAGQVLVEQDAFVQVDLPAGDLPCAIHPPQGVNPFADEGALLV